MTTQAKSKMTVPLSNAIVTAKIVGYEIIDAIRGRWKLQIEGSSHRLTCLDNDHTFGGQSRIGETITGLVRMECGQLLVASGNIEEAVVDEDKNFDGDSLEIQGKFWGRMNEKCESLVVIKGPILVVTDFESHDDLVLPDVGSVVRAKGLLAFEPVDSRMIDKNSLE